MAGAAPYIITALLMVVSQQALGEMSDAGVKKEASLTDYVARAISVVLYCGGRQDLAERFVAQQDKMLSVCEATPDQITEIKAHLLEYEITDCSVLESAIRVLDELHAMREEYVNSLPMLKQIPRGTFTCS